MKILLVDEDRASLEVLGAALKGRGDVEIITAGSAEEAFHAVEGEERVDVLVTAGLMAPQDGFHLSAALRAQFPKLRVAYVSKTDLTRHAAKIGGDIVFYKPVDVAALVRWLDDPTVGRRKVEDESISAVSGGERVETEGRTESRTGMRIGDYELGRLLVADAQMETYEAMQVSVQRRVAFTLLREEVRESDPGAVKYFREMVRVKAAVVHQHIAPVYEAHEEDDAIFYTRELVEGRSLNGLREIGARLEPLVMVSLIRVVAESFESMVQHGIPYKELTAGDIFLGSDDQARLTNIADLRENADTRPEREQILSFAKMVKPLARLEDGGVEGAVISRLIETMGHETDDEANGSWAMLSKASHAAAQELEKENVAELPDIERRAKWASVKRKIVRAALLGGSVVAVALVFKVLLGAVSFFDRPEAKNFDEMVRVPAGRFQYQDEEELRELEAFWIDEYEVTVAQYAEFLEALREDSSLAARIDHPDLPASKRGHEPAEWGAYFRAARRGDRFNGQLVDLNCPITLVDWWDAYAYGKWKGRRLPTEEEWEKAARGRKGNVYPWGNEFLPRRLESSAEGFLYWSPVDAMGLDVSDYFVKGMAGNVSEWTGSWTNHLEYPDRQVPVQRGGSFATQTGYELDRRRPANSPEEKKITVGFRTVSSTRPDK